MLHIRRRARSALATVVDLIVSPFGYQVNVLANTALPGIEAFSVFRLPPDMPRARRLRSRPAPYRRFDLEA